MINGKYIIVPGENNTQNVSLNPDALGNAWFVENIDWANNADQEITLLGEINPKTTAVINKKFEKEVKPFSYDSLATITLTKYEPNRLTYTAKTQGEQLAVFSEIYYPGWKALVNGKETEIFQTDYILRTINVTAGTSEIEFYFKPSSIKTTNTISYIVLIIIFAGIVLAVLTALGVLSCNACNKCSESKPEM